MSVENVVYIGSKPVMNYCLAVLTSLQDKGSVTLKARGRAISTAVDVAEVTRTRFMENLTVENIEIGTEELESLEGRMRNVSTMTIVLKKNSELRAREQGEVAEVVDVGVGHQDAVRSGLPDTIPVQALHVGYRLDLLQVRYVEGLEEGEVGVLVLL